MSPKRWFVSEVDIIRFISPTPTDLEGFATHQHREKSQETLKLLNIDCIYISYKLQLHV